MPYFQVITRRLVEADSHHEALEAERIIEVTSSNDVTVAPPALLEAWERRKTYDRSMKYAESLYFDIVAAMPYEAYVTQTGGMCLAIQVLHPERKDVYVLVTDAEDPLPWDRDELTDRWAVGLYQETEDGGERWLIKYVDNTRDLRPLALEVKRLLDTEDFDSLDWEGSA